MGDLARGIPSRGSGMPMDDHKLFPMKFLVRSLDLPVAGACETLRILLKVYLGLEEDRASLSRWWYRLSSHERA